MAHVSRRPYSIKAAGYPNLEVLRGLIPELREMDVKLLPSDAQQFVANGRDEILLIQKKRLYSLFCSSPAGRKESVAEVAAGCYEGFGMDE